MLQVVFALVLVSTFVTSPIVAVTSQGLEWGVEPDDEFAFRYHLVEEGKTVVNDIVNITVPLFPQDIDDPLPEWVYLPIVYPDIVYANGTLLGSEASYIYAVVYLVGSFFVPIGNFSLLTDLIMDSTLSSGSHTVINDGTNWGVQFTFEWNESRASWTFKYKKTDGFLNELSLVGTNTTSNLRTTANLSRLDGFDISELIQDNILYIGIGVAVIVILGAVACRRR